MNGSEIRAIRLKLSLTPSQFAQLLGLSSSTVVDALEQDEVKASSPTATILRTLNGLPKKEAEDFVRSLLVTSVRQRQQAHPG